MGLFSKLKEANHKRNQTRNSIFLSSDSVASNTSSETSNFKQPTSNKNVPMALQPNNHAKQRPKSEYYNMKRLPKIQKQELFHARSQSNQENELPLVGMTDDTLNFDANDVSLDEVTEQLIDHQLFSVLDNKKSKPINAMFNTENTKYHVDRSDLEEDFHPTLDPNHSAQNLSTNDAEISHIPTKVPTPLDNFNEPSQSLILNQQQEPMEEPKQEEKEAQPVHMHYDVQHLFVYPNQQSQVQHNESSAITASAPPAPAPPAPPAPPATEEADISHSQIIQTPTKHKAPEPEKSLEQLDLPSQEQYYAPIQQQSNAQQTPASTIPPLKLPLESQLHFNYNQTYQTSPQFYSMPQTAHDNEGSADEDDISSSEYSSSSQDQDDEDEDEESVSSGSSVPPTQHPYYEQWRRYYEALALQQQQFMMSQQQMNPGAFPGFNPMMFYGNPQMMQQMQMQMQMQLPYVYNPFMTQSSAVLNGSQGNVNLAATMYQQHAQSQPLLNQIPPQEQQHDVLPPPVIEKKVKESSTQAPLKITPSPPSKRNSYVSVAQAAEHPIESQVPHDYLLSYKKSRNLHSEKVEEDNGLISNSRRSTLKSNRYASAPISFTQKSRMSSMAPNGRVTSLEMNFKPSQYRPYGEDDEYNSQRNIKSLSNSVTQSTQSFAKLNLQDRDTALTRQISDYSKYLFDDDEDEDSEDEAAEEMEEEDNTARRVDILGHRKRHSLSGITPNTQLPTPDSPEGLSRNGTAASYNSIESGGSSKFVVADGRRKPAATAIPPRPTKGKKKGKKSKKQSKKNNQQPNGYPFNPNMSMPELPMGSMMPMAPPQPPQTSQPQFASSTDQFMMMNYSNPLLSQLTEYGGNNSAPRSRRQSITTTDSKRRSMMMETTPSPKFNKRNSVPLFNTQKLNQKLQKQSQKQSTPPPSPPKVQDSTINKKIEQFINLRSKIAAGNKTAEYRLHWVKMLIMATNYKLYSYINIKGEGIMPEQQASNKAQFVKSSVTHITKLIKEFASGVQEKDGVRCEAYFIYANLFKQDYLISYNQDFNTEKNIDRAVEYYEKVLGINEKDFKALYKLGEIYEYELNDFNKAVEYYTLAAKYGYNRAILKMAMFYLQMPDMRTIKYFKYLKNLSNIDLDDVQLDEEDMTEMEEVIGLACYELGKIFEGIYPGDLTTEDEFIKKSLELAPVNYAKSVTYYNKSAKLNCLLAQVRLGIVYERGELNRQQNASKSIQWYIKASSSPLSFKRHPDAMVGLARWCLQGSDGASKYIPTPVPDRAVIWCERAIDEFNSPDAMNFMGELCEMGIAKGKARQWYDKAYRLGNQEAGHKMGYY